MIESVATFSAVARINLESTTVPVIMSTSPIFGHLKLGLITNQVFSFKVLIYEEVIFRKSDSGSHQETGSQSCC